GHGALEANSVGQKDRDWHIVLAHVLQEGVVKSVRVRCSHDRSPWTFSYLSANSPALCTQNDARALPGVSLRAIMPRAKPAFAWLWPSRSNEVRCLGHPELSSCLCQPTPN